MADSSQRKYQYERFTCGPFLRFGDYSFTDPMSPLWSGSILFLCKACVSSHQAPVLVFMDHGEQGNLPGRIIDMFQEYQFWRFDLVLRCGRQERQILYWVQLHPDYKAEEYSWNFFIPGGWDPWRWASYSCSGFSLSVDQAEWGGPDQPLWKDLMVQHTRKPLHALVGGGDQLYNDEVFHLPLLKNWLEIKNRHKRLRAEFTDAMKADAELFYFEHYCTHFMATGMREALASIPNVMMWDDHDIFDGWGSYPDDLLRSPVFEGLYDIACRFYLLFQQHTTNDMVSRGEADLFGASFGPFGEKHRSHSFLKCFGQTVAVVGADTRSERSKRQIMSRPTWDMICARIRTLPLTIQHLIIVFTVPIIYPKVPLTETVLSGLGYLNRIQAINTAINKTGILTKIMAFDEPELLDDLVDHWTANEHMDERRRCVETLQKIAIERGVRVTFLSGDVHAAAVGRFYSKPKMKDLSKDPNFMPQIITSAIVNNPPPAALVKSMQFFNTAGLVNSWTKEKMVRMFSKTHPRTSKILARRNWLKVEASEEEPGSLSFQFRFEEDHRKLNDPLQVCTVVVPPLVGYGSKDVLHGPLHGSAQERPRPTNVDLDDTSPGSLLNKLGSHSIGPTKASMYPPINLQQGTDTGVATPGAVYHPAWPVAMSTPPGVQGSNVHDGVSVASHAGAQAGKPSLYPQVQYPQAPPGSGGTVPDARYPPI